MIRALLGIFFIGLVGSAIAQDFSLSADSFEKVFTMTDGEDRDDVIHSTFRNDIPGGQRTFIWERTEQYLSPGWTSAVCDLNRCYIETVAIQSFRVGPGIESTMDIHNYTNSTTGDSSIILIKMYEEGIPETFITQKYKFVNSKISSSKEIAYDDVRIYPNPASEYFMIENDNFSVNNLEIYNIAGKFVTRYDTTDHNKYDIKDLAKGLYLVRLNGKNKILKTLRLNVI